MSFELNVEVSVGSADCPDIAKSRVHASGEPDGVGEHIHCSSCSKTRWHFPAGYLVIEHS